MSRWEIYKKDGTHRTDTQGDAVLTTTLEYSGKRMAERMCVVKIVNPYPIDFKVGDYLSWRGEKFSINDVPSAKKVARRGSYGESFSYEGMKFLSEFDLLRDIQFIDKVLEDNAQHYAFLPSFSFYAQNVEDLLDRIQANIDGYDNGYDIYTSYVYETPIKLTDYVLGQGFCYRNQPVEVRSYYRELDDSTTLIFKIGPENDGTFAIYIHTMMSDEDVYEYENSTTTDDPDALEIWNRATEITNNFNPWIILSPSYSRSLQRNSNVTEDMWKAVYGNDTTEPTYDFDGENIQIDNMKVWDVIGLINTTFDLRFSTSGRRLYVEKPNNHLRTLSYGKDKGLYEITRVADSTQEDYATEIRPFGNQTNIPNLHYALFYARPYIYIGGPVENNGWVFYGVQKEQGTTPTGSPFPTDAFMNHTKYLSPGGGWVSRDLPELTDGDDVYSVGMAYNSSAEYVPVLNGTSITNESALCYYAHHNSHYYLFVKKDSAAHNYIKKMQEVAEYRVFFNMSVYKQLWPLSHLFFLTANYTKTLSWMNLMPVLCYFGDNTNNLYEWIKNNGGTDCDDESGKATFNGVTAYFSKYPFDPYIRSINSDKNIRTKVLMFDGSNKELGDIYPTQKEVTGEDIHNVGVSVIATDTDFYGIGVDETIYQNQGFKTRIDEIQTRAVAEDGTAIVDDGVVYNASSDGTNDITRDATSPTDVVTLVMPKRFIVKIPPQGYDVAAAIEQGGADAYLSMMSGKCQGREFKIVEAEKCSLGYYYGWQLTCERKQDPATGRWYPYYDYPIDNGDGANDGDYFVITGIQFPSILVQVAALKLIKKSLEWLAKNNTRKLLYEVKITEQYMAREQDKVNAARETDPTSTIKSTYETIDVDDVFVVMDSDLGNIAARVDTLTIKENEQGGLPIYNVTLKSDEDLTVPAGTGIFTDEFDETFE